MDSKDFIEGIENIKSFTDDEIIQMADTFENEKNSPLAILYHNIIKWAIYSHYWELSHIPKNVSSEERSMRLSEITGRIAEAESFYGLPKIYNEAKEKILEERAKESDKKPKKKK